MKEVKTHNTDLETIMLLLLVSKYMSSTTQNVSSKINMKTTSKLQLSLEFML